MDVSRMKKAVVIVFLCVMSGICQIQAQLKPEIEHNQFDITERAVTFTADGGKKTLTITADKDWTVKIQPESWAKLKQNKKSITINVSANSATQEKSTSFTITSGGKDISVKITQAAASGDRISSGNKNSRQSATSATFEISETSVSFGASGGSKIFTVKSTHSWYIGTRPAFWGHLSRNGNNLILYVDANKDTSKRSDWFSIVSSGKKIHVDITQSANPPKPIFEISATSAYFNANGGTESFAVTSNNPWEIETNTASWVHLDRNGNKLTLTVDANNKPEARTGYFVIKSGDKTLRVDISQAQGDEVLSVNGSSTSVSVGFGSYGGSKDIDVNTNMGGYELKYKPSWCYITDKTATGFTLGCYSNTSSYDRKDWMEVKAGGKTVRINISQDADYSKWCRRIDGGWVNMALGVEGGYNVSEGNWYANGVIGMRIGNYRDIVQLELGAAPGVITSEDGDNSFHLPLYGSLKLSVRSGKFYLKAGGAYNVVYDDYCEGKYSLRAGFGSAWKHFEWDWAFVQFNAPSDRFDSEDMFDLSNMMVGMRMAWYITR